jgi:RHS repeat-associated protein
MAKTKHGMLPLRTELLRVGFLGFLIVQFALAVTLTLGVSPSATAQTYCDTDEPDNDGDEGICTSSSYSTPSVVKSIGTYTPDLNIPPPSSSLPSLSPSSSSPPCACARESGDPIDNTTGNLFDVQQDYVGGGPFPLQLVRHYNSLGSSAGPFGFNWSHGFGASIQQLSGTSTKVVRGGGKALTFTLNSGVWTQEANVNSRLTQLTNAGVTTGWSYTTGDDNVETYNASGKLTAITNRAGLTQTLGYDAQGRLSSVTDPFGRTLGFTYDAQNRITGMSNPAGGAYVYAYDGNGNLISIRYPDGATRGYVYENSAFLHALTGIVDENGARFATWGYNAGGLAISSQHAGGADKVTVSYDFTKGITTVTDAFGSQTIYSYTTILGVALPVAVSRPTSDRNGFGYDVNGNVYAYGDNIGNVTTYSYNTRNLETSRTLPTYDTISTTWHSTFRLPTQIIEPNNRTTTFSYDAHGNPLTKSVFDLSTTRTWTYTYNSSGQVLTVDGPRTDVQDVTTFTYDSNGNLATITDALGHLTRITQYDANGNPLSLTDPNGLVTAFTYDARQRLTSKSVGSETTTYAYDAAGNLIKVTFSDGSFLAYSYDTAHRLVGVSDGLGNRIAYTLNAVGKRVKVDVFDPSNTLKQTRSQAFDTVYRLVQAIGAQKQTTAFTYDNDDNLVTLTDPLLNATSYSYDSINRLSGMTDPGSGATSFSYNYSDNQITYVQDPRNLYTSYSYDGLKNVKSVYSPDTGYSSNTYDAAGNLITSTDGRYQQTSYTYDALNRLIKTTYADGKTVVYAYDQGTNGLGRLSSITDSSGSTAWLYDAHGRAVQKQQTIGAIVLTTKYTYDGQGRLIQTTYPSGRQVGYAYDAAGRVKAITVDGQSLLSGIGYRPFGAAAGWTWSNGSAYGRTFDLDGRLNSFSLGTDTRTLTYDAAGRITGVSDLATLQPPNLPAGTSQYVISTSSNQLTSQSGLVSATYSYDAAGNRTGDGVRQFAYDARGRMSQVTVGGSITQYSINGLGQRVAKTGASVTSGSLSFAYDEAGHLLGEYDVKGNAVQETIWFGGAPVAVVKPNSGLFFVFIDQLGTPRVVTTQSLRTVWSWNSDPFGSGAPSEGVDDIGVKFTYNLRFPGQYFDQETGLQYNYFRDYDPSIGRYIQSDPVGLRGGINTYAYVRGNSVSYVDQYGLAWQVIVTGSGTIIVPGGGATLGGGVGINLDWWNSSVFANAQANGGVGGGVFVGAGFGLGAAQGDAPTTGRTVTPYMEGDAGWGVSGGAGAAIDKCGNIISAGANAPLPGVKLGGGWGLGAFGGYSATATYASPTIGNIWQGLQNGWNSLNQGITDWVLGNNAMWNSL